MKKLNAIIMAVIVATQAYAQYSGGVSQASLATKADIPYVDSSVAAEAEDRIDADDALREIILSGQAISYEYYLSTNAYTAGLFSYTPTNMQYQNCNVQSTDVGSFTYTYAAAGTYGYVAFCTNNIFYTNAAGTAYAYDYASENGAGDIYEKIELYAFIVGSTNEVELGDAAIPLQVTVGTTPVMRTFNIPYQAYSNTNGYYFGLKKKCTAKGAGSTVTQWVGDGYNTHVDLSLPSSILADFYVAKTDVVQTLSGDEADKVPSVAAVNTRFDEGIAITTNPVVATVAEGTSSNAVSGAGVKSALVGIDQLTEIVTTNITKMFVVEYPQQSNGKSQGGVMPTYPAEYYTTGVAGTYISTYDYTDGGAGDLIYSGVLKINALETSAEIGTYLGIKDLFNITNFYFARAMRGGSALTVFEKGTAMYSNMLLRVTGVKTNAPTAGVPDAIIWGQGETGTSPATADAYYSQATNLIANMRADLSNATLKVIFTGYANNANPLNTTYVDTAKKRICAEDANCVFLEARAWETLPAGNVHYSALGQISRGRSSGNATAGMMRGLKMSEGFRTDEAYVGRLGANLGSFGNIKAGNITVDGRLKAGIIEDGTKAFDPWYVQLYLPFSSKDGVPRDPISWSVMTNAGAALVTWDTNRLEGVWNPSGYATGTNYTQLDKSYFADTNMVFAFWIMNTNITTIGTLLGQSSSAYTNAGLTAIASGGGFVWKLRESIGSGGSTCNWTAYSSTAWDDGLWHRIYFAISGTNMLLAVDGIVQGSAQIFSGTLSDVSVSECMYNKIGHGYSSAGAVTGNDSLIDNLIVLTNTVGTIQSALSDYNFQIKGDSGIRGYR